jgi:hypothetical protein
MLSGYLNGQNLVPNPSFEEYITCPDFVSQIERVSEWDSYRNTPDYHNACDLSNVVGVPFSIASGYQEAKDGDAYVGYHQYTSLVNSEVLTEVIGVQLNAALTIGQEYYVSFFVNRAIAGGIDAAGNCWSNGQAARFSMNPYESWPPEVAVPVDNFSHVYNQSLISDTADWLKVEGFFTPDSAYQYLSIGNFYLAEELTVECEMEYSTYTTYYFVDCVCVAPDQSDCDYLLSNNDIASTDETIRVFPTPFSNQISIVTDGQALYQFNILDLSGKIVRSGVLPRGTELHIISDLDSLTRGAYLVRIISQNTPTRHINLLKI